jgi:hypothetical protein
VPKQKRNYRKEYDNYHSKAEQKKNRAARNTSRRKAIKAGRAAKGDGKDVHHVKPLAKGGSRKGATRVVSKSKNRSFKRTKTARMA